VIGDTQETMTRERLLLRRESNSGERARLFARLEAERPAFLVINGDLTSNGSSERRWQYFDSLTTGLRGQGVPILPTLGNHDYWGGKRTALRAFTARFTQFGESHWYVRRYGALTLVFLDSNRGELGKDAWQRQQQWLERTLGDCDADPATRGVLVFAHDPPFTNGTVTSDDEAVQRDVVPALVRARKTLALISGHTHSYEHFVDQGKHFIVSGGGGGPRVKLRTGRRARHPDLFAAPAPRPFHFLWITPGTAGLRVEVRGFDKGETIFRTIDQFDLAWPSRAGA
jgi:3',5'-cyclic AMP phosphodiesterase CpdA